MRGIEQRSGCIWYYGNPAGYIDKSAAVMDTMFRNDELERWLAKNNLTARWTDGVYERLSGGGIPDTASENAPILKSCRIWQLRPGAAAWKDIVSFGKPLPEPEIEDYAVVYDGQLSTNELEAIYDQFTERQPQGFSGHPLSVSDLVELYDSGGHDFYYLDRTCFRQVEFAQAEQGFEMTM
ncbi:MAG: YodL domain-containing protein [Oscillospiraceae bacterium]